ncbi:diiron oxygenase [Nocardia sp. NPDC050175]|uniref:diiron oxygenase n=1 Tax=Nocardia sp. NPDC050175 TaxID=3364317 RepID=UPI0037B7374C
MVAGELSNDRYRSPFRSWDERAAVRSAPRRELPSETEGQHFFSPDLVPLARHGRVRNLPPDLFDQLVIQHLYRYLDFTAKLEQFVVNRTALGIAQGTIGILVPAEMRLDAHRIYCDEAYHALSAAELMHQVELRTGVRPMLPEVPYFMTRLAEIQQRMGSSFSALAEIIFVIVSETLISGTLSEIPDDPEVVPTVSEVIRDHAADEGRHHTYFAHFLKELWAQSDRSTRRIAGLLAPEMILAFLRPDVPAMRAELVGYGFSRDTTEQILAEILPEELIQATARGAAQQTVRHFARLGVLDDAETMEAFQKHGLI